MAAACGGHSRGVCAGAAKGSAARFAAPASGPAADDGGVDRSTAASPRAPAPARHIAKPAGLALGATGAHRPVPPEPVPVEPFEPAPSVAESPTGPPLRDRAAEADP